MQEEEASMSRKQWIGALAIAFVATSAQPALAQFESIQQLQRYHAGIGEKIDTRDCEAQFHSFAARQTSPTERQKERAACLEHARAGKMDGVAASDPIAPRAGSPLPTPR